MRPAPPTRLPLLRRKPGIAAAAVGGDGSEARSNRSNLESVEFSELHEKAPPTVDHMGPGQYQSSRGGR